MLNSSIINKAKPVINKENKVKELTPEELSYLNFANKKVSLIGHSVKSEDMGLIQYFYPEFKVMNQPSLFINSPVIWTGDAKYLNTLKESKIPVISVTNLAEYSLSDKDTLIQLTFTKWNKPVPKYLYSIKDLLDYDTVLDNVKLHWIDGKWRLKEFKDLKYFLEFITNLRDSESMVMKRYFNLVAK